MSHVLSQEDEAAMRELFPLTETESLATQMNRKLVFTKPPPPPPKFGGPRPPVRAATAPAPTTRQLEHYALPMAREHMPAWVQVLIDCKLPLDVIVLDFEMYFDDTLHMGSAQDALGTIEYVKHKDSEVLSVAATHMFGEQPFADYAQRTTFWETEPEVEKFVRYLQGNYGPNLERCVVVAQNATFDASILAYRYGVYPKHLIDILGLSRAWNSRQKNDLASLCKEFNLPPKGDTAQFKGLTFRTRFVRGKGRKKGPKLPVQVPKFTPDQVKALAEYNRNDNLREWELFTLLLPRLSNPATELRVMQHTIELFTKPVLRVDAAKGTELVGLYEQQIDNVINPLGVTRKDISGDKSFEALLLTALEAAGDNPQQYYKVCKRGWMLALAKDDPERQKLLAHSSERVRQLMQARGALDSWPLHIARVNRMMRQAAANDGVLPVPLKYHGAHTGRASGGEKINLQNLGSRGDPLITAIRGMIVAPPGHVLAIVDAAQIEARVLAWIAGQADAVERWARNEDQYSLFAAKVVGYPVRKPRKGEIPAIAKRLKWARDSIGKIGVLGCGYGMGAEKTEAYAKGAIDLDTATKIVQTFRAEHKDIVGFWHSIEKAFVYTAKYHRPCELPRGLRFHSDPAADVILTLPNGREIHYCKVKLADSGRGEKIELYNAMEHKWEYTWGGSLTENVVQAMSRDILMEAMLRLEAIGYHTAHHIHDELVLCVLRVHGPPALSIAQKELARTPAWAPGLPLGAEGVISERYGKY